MNTKNNNSKDQTSTRERGGTRKSYPIRRTLQAREVEFALSNGKLSDHQKLLVCSALFIEGNLPNRRQFTFNPEVRSDRDLQEAIGQFEEHDVDPASLSALQEIVKPCEDDLIIPEKLKRLILKGKKFAVFVGAGASMASKIPSWSELADKALETLEKKQYISYAEKQYLKEKKDWSDPRQILSMFHQFVPLDSPEAEAFYRLHLDRECDPNSIYSSLAALNCIKVTTNLEYLFKVAAQEYYRSIIKEDQSGSDTGTPPIVVESVCVPTSQELDVDSLSTKFIYHLHGTMDTIPNAVMTTERYISSYYGVDNPQDPRPQNVYRFLTALFRDYNVLFVGTSVTEFVVLERILGENSNKNSYFALLPVSGDQLFEFCLLQKYFSSFRIEPCPYFLDQEGHARCGTVLESWVKEIDGSRGNYGEIASKVLRVLHNDRHG